MAIEHKHLHGVATKSNKSNDVYFYYSINTNFHCYRQVFEKSGWFLIWPNGNLALLRLLDGFMI